MQPAKREIVGQWWLPSAPEEKWVGTLTLEPNKAAALSVTIPKGFQFLEGKAQVPIRFTYAREAFAGKLS